MALGVTSTDGMVKRLGAIRWNRLHKLVYVITALGILHYYMQSKVDVSQPVLMTGFFFWLMGYRLMAARGYKEGLLPLLVLSVSAALLTAAAEAAWYGIATGIGAWRPLMANLDFSFSIRPAWWVLAAGLAVTIASELRKRLKLGGTPARRARARPGLNFPSVLAPCHNAGTDLALRRAAGWMEGEHHEDCDSGTGLHARGVHDAVGLPDDARRARAR